ncbi:hypothetical protein Bca52824_012679 [Brassica carinata]|uniref:Uncharacterized protein n=1 Tax=Brassica carinata TaxID=52824 RepID=A0A8X7VXX7_BRACI|nr:hypothetical protein Bca52824_012679 [Brassica carinata]
MVKATLIAIPGSDMTSSCLAWTVVFEKIGLDNQNSEQIVGTLKNLIEKIDRNLYQQDNKMNTMYVESTVVECFKAINEAFKNDADVEIEAEDRDNMTTTLSLKSSHVFMTNFKMIKVTITVTPHHEDDDGSLLQWILEIDNGGITRFEFPDIREMIKNKLRK